MSTHGIIGYYTTMANRVWKGRYHHFDAYPTGLGSALWRHLHGHFKGDLKKFLKVLTEEHTSWQTICHRQMSFKWRPRYPESGVKKEIAETFKACAPECFCHGDSGVEMDDWLWSHQNAILGARWAYVFDRVRKVLHVFQRVMAIDIPSKGKSEAQPSWHLEAAMNLRGLEPEWDVIEYGRFGERCKHEDKAHAQDVKEART